MKYGIQFPNSGGFFEDPKDVANLARDAEKAGWDGFFVWDHLMLVRHPKEPFYDPWMLLSLVATNTKKIKLGPMVTPVPRRRPWVLARECTTLDHLSDGRAMLGVGLGAPDYEYANFGEDKNLKTRAQKLDEGLDIIQGLWSGEPFKYKGEHYQIRKTRFLPKPVNGSIPIFASCTYTPDFSIKKPIHRAMKYNGLIMAHYEYPLKQVEPNEVKEMVKYVNAHRNSNGPFEFFLNGISPENLKERKNKMKQYKEAGLTWWMEKIDAEYYENSYDKICDKIVQGPPNIR
ncbi:MAG: LLM class flavin-dependent oxidoreductase [Candidatus Hermodarchaeota archaeon]